MIAKAKKEKSQIVFWQETHLQSPEHEKLKKMGFRNTFYSSYKRGRKRGVAILISNSLNFEFISEIKDKEGRFIFVKGKLDHKEVTLLNIYAPPGSNKTFFKKMFDLISCETLGVLICAGDLNMIFNPKLDTNNQKRKKNNLEIWVKKRLQDLGLVDIWRDLHKQDRQYTFYSARHNVHSRIDYFLMYNSEKHRVKESRMGTRDLSDHSSVYLKLHMDSKCKNTLWRLNTSLLNDPVFKTTIKGELQTYLENNNNGQVNPVTLWDAAKAVLRGKIISITAFMRKAKAQKLTDLQNKLLELEQSHSKQRTPLLLQQMRTTKQEIDKIHSEELEKKLRFTRQKYYEAGSKATKLLAWRLRKQQAENTIHEIRVPKSNKTTCTLDGIQKAFETYYKSLYTQPDRAEAHTVEQFLNQLDLPSIGKLHNDDLTKEITREEVDKAISGLKAGKSPGADGFPGEWYKSFRDQVIPLLCECFNHVLKEGVLPPSWREAIISIIPKEGKDRKKCSGYRPISVLNQDYKLYASILTKRMEKVLPLLISEDQTGFISNRRTQDNIRRCLHIIEQIKHEKTSAILVSLDAEKAFDSVGWDYLYQVMEKFGFCKKFIQCIKTLYSSPTARIKINGHLSETIHLQRGCRQGCPASPGLFNLFIEPLAQLIRQETILEGITIGGTEHKICLYADDVLVALKKPASSVPLLMDLLTMYGTLSGYTLNIEKTQALVFNFNPPHDLATRYNFKWNSTSIKYLGVKLTKDTTQLYNENYTVVSKKIGDDFDRWGTLPLDFGSRIMTTKMNILPRLLYLFQSLPVQIPDSQFKVWDKQISRFIWEGKKPRIRYNTLQLPREEGGMALPCLRDFYVAAQLTPLILWCNPEYEANWKDIELSISGRPVQSLLGCPSVIKDLPNLQNQWVYFSLNVWSDFVKKFQIQKEIKILRWPAFDPDFKPASLDSKYRQWTRYGITSYSSLVKDGKLMDFQSISEKYGLERQDLYRHTQIQHYYQHEVKGLDSEEQSGVTQLFMKAYDSKLSRRIIGNLYSSILLMKTHSTDYIKQKWERELEIAISPEEWTAIIHTQISTTNSQCWRSFCWKNLVRFFITPKIKSKHTGHQTQCWRQCGQLMADHAHIFWTCPTLQPFWTEVQATTKRILGFDIDFTCISFYLGNILKDLHNRDRYLLKILMAASKKAITRCWLLREPPTLNLWKRIINDIYSMESITFILRLQKEKGKDYWAKWVTYLAECDG